MLGDLPVTNIAQYALIHVVFVYISSVLRDVGITLGRSPGRMHTKTDGQCFVVLTLQFHWLMNRVLQWHDTAFCVEDHPKI